MSNKINDLAYNQKLWILSIHFILCALRKTLVKSIGCVLCPLITIIGHFGLGKLLSGIDFAKLSTSVGMGTYKHLHTNTPFRFPYA